MNTRQRAFTILFAIMITVVVTIQHSHDDAAALTLDPIEGKDIPEKEIVEASMSPKSGITVIRDSIQFVGRVGDLADSNSTQSATYRNFDLSSASPGMPAITNRDGILLTTGTANIPFSNTGNEFGLQVCIRSLCSDDELLKILSSANYFEPISDVNSISFDFTVERGMSMIEADFVFGSDEFPEQGVTDIFAFIVDGKNYAYFPDGSLVSFVMGQNKNYFNDNQARVYGLEYDGISNLMHVAGKLDEGRSIHTLKIAIADTSDQIIDSGVFIGNIRATDAVLDSGVTLGAKSTVAEEMTVITPPRTEPTEEYVEPDYSSYDREEAGFFDYSENQMIVGGIAVAATIAGIVIILIKTGMFGTKSVVGSAGSIGSPISSGSGSSSSSSSSGTSDSGAESSSVNSAETPNVVVEIEISGGIEK